MNRSAEVDGGSAHRAAYAPPVVLALAHSRREARAGRDWAEADRLKAAIEAAGWRVVDRGVDFALVPALAPDVVREGRTWYGSAVSVPSRLDEPDGSSPTVVLIAAPDPTGGGEAAAGAASLAGAWPGAGYVIVVPERAGDLPDRDATADGGAAEVIGLAGDPVPAELLAAGARRASGRLVAIVTPGVIPDARTVADLLAALEDPSIAAAGSRGGRTDLRSLDPVASGDADVLLPGIIAVRRDDLARADLFEPRLRSWSAAVEWLTLSLREPREAGGPVRRALVVESAVPAAAPIRDDAARKDFYRLLDRFGRSAELLSRAG